MALALSLAGEAGDAPAAAPNAVTIRVVAKDFSFTLSRRSVPKGAPVTFLVRNAGAVVHDFVIAGRRTRPLRPGQTATLTAGGYAMMPSKHAHQFACTKACTAFVSSDGAFDIHYLDANGKEIPPEAALKKK